MNTLKNIETHVIDFHLHQYLSVRKEIEDCIKETRTLERYAIIATGAVWIWLLTQTPNTTTAATIPKIGWWIPFLLSFSCASRSATLVMAVVRASRYIRKMEKVFSYSKEIPGWETFVATEKQVCIVWPTVAYWVIILFLTITIPFFIVNT